MKVVTVVGTRPQLIKCATLSRELRLNHREVLINTGQHYDSIMSQVFFDELKIPEPDYNLNVGSGSHGFQTGRILMALEGIILAEMPDLILVFGDTNSTLAGALCGAKIPTPVVHVEAGLRSFDRSMPEEINRVLTDHASDLLLCPTRNSMTNLEREGLAKRALRVGDVTVDALCLGRTIIESKSDVLKRFGLEKGQYVVMTLHRASNTDDQRNLRSIIKAMGGCGKTIIFPIHPRTQRAMETTGIGASLPKNLRTVNPLGYPDMIQLMSQASTVVTDSGGIQKESFLLGVKCITLRENTEWPETLVGGWNTLVGADESLILKAFESRPSGSRRGAPFGRIGASKRIVRGMERFLERLKSKVSSESLPYEMRMS